MSSPPRAVIPTGMESAGAEMMLSPAILSGDHLFLTGMTGSGADGQMPEDPETQFRAAFDKIATVLEAAGADWSAVVEMTSYHVGLQEHFDCFNAVRGAYVQAPFPAWTAVEVAGLRRAGALVEIRVIARNPESAERK